MSIHPGALADLLNGAECEICGSPNDLALDHDHACCAGNYSCGDCLRGVLCRSCNVSLAYLGKVDAELVEPMLDYLHSPPGVDAQRFTAATVDSHPGRARRLAA